MRTDILLNKWVGLCWDPRTVKFTGVFNCICSKAVVSEPWPNLFNRFCWNYHNCLLFESRITGQNRQYSSVKNDECKRDRKLINGALFLVNHWSRNPRDLSLFWCCVTSSGHSRGKNRNHFVEINILQRISWPFFQEALTAHKVYS